MKQEQNMFIDINSNTRMLWHFLIKRQGSAMRSNKIEKNLIGWNKKMKSLTFQELYEEYNKKVASRPVNYQEIDPACLRWSPPVTMDNNKPQQ